MGYAFRYADKTVTVLTDVFIGIATMLLAAMATIGTLDVLSLNLLNSPVPAASEIASAMLPITVILALAYAQRQDAHIKVDLVSQHFPPWMARLSNLLSLAIGVFVFTLISWGSWELAMSSIEVWEEAVALVRFPIWPVKVVFALGAVVCTLEILRELIRFLIGADEVTGAAAKPHKQRG